MAQPWVSEPPTCRIKKKKKATYKKYRPARTSLLGFLLCHPTFTSGFPSLNSVCSTNLPFLTPLTLVILLFSLSIHNLPKIYLCFLYTNMLLLNSYRILGEVQNLFSKNMHIRRRQSSQVSNPRYSAKPSACLVLSTSECWGLHRAVLMH